MHDSPLVMQPASGTPHASELPPELAGCAVVREDLAGRALLRIVDGQMKTLGSGLQIERAIRMALRSRHADELAPQHYCPRLKGCMFQRETPTCGLGRVMVLDPYGRVLAAHNDPEAACREAERELLRHEPAAQMDLADFSKLCTVLTVQLVRGATGRAKRGEPRLQHLCSLAGLRAALARQYRRRAPEFGQDPHGCAVPLGVLNARTEAFLAQNVFDPQQRQVHPVDLDGELIVLRTAEAPDAPQCIEMAHHYLIALAEEQRLAQACSHTQRMTTQRQRG